MTKLINDFRANPTDKARAKLVAYIAKHPMAGCMLTAEDAAFLRANGIRI